jgi:hypothetical protein
MGLIRTYLELRGNSCIRTVNLSTDKDIVTLKQISQERMRITSGLTGSEFNPKADFPSGVVRTWVSTGSESLIC